MISRLTWALTQILDGTNNVLKLQKALYGLKQAPRSWCKALTGKMKKKGYIICPVDRAVACIRLCGQVVVVLIYVDDVLAAAKCLSAVEAAKHLLLSFFDGTDKGEVCGFLGYLIHEGPLQSSHILGRVQLYKEDFI
jgi:hypothetical protein